jgi:thiol-disulfide isomerase/thioredoxin
MRKALFIFFLLVSVSCFSQSNTSALIKQFDLLNNKPFPLLELEDENGNMFNTSALAGKTLYVDFWFTQCPPCLKELPYAKELKMFFAADTSVVFVNICIEYADRKQAWKDMIKEKEIGGINLFYARNRPQKVNLLREYKVEDFPTYMLVDAYMKIIGYNAPRPSDKGLINWTITQAKNNIKVSEAYKAWISNTPEVLEFKKRNAAVL